MHLLEHQEADDQVKIEWLRGATEQAFAAFDKGEGVPLTSTDIDALVNGAIEEGRAARRKIHA